MHPHDPHRRAFTKLAEAIGREEGWAQYEAFSAFVEAGYRSIRGAFLRGDEWQKNEDEYMKIVRRCRNPTRTMGRIAEMMAATVAALDAECSDFLGPVYMDIGGSKGLGQFFTPHALSSAAARMTLGDIKALVEGSERGYFTADEPAVGMGGMVLAVAEYMREQGFEPARHCHWRMVDVEWKAMAGCYIQTSLAGVSGIVVHGNSLSLQQWQCTPTPMAVLFPKRFDHAPPPPIEVEAAAPDPPPPTQIPAPRHRRKERPGQMTFDFFDLSTPPSMANEGNPT